MLRTCQEPGCTTIVMGGRCLEHERRPTRVFVRGRPFVSDDADSAPSGVGVMTLAGTRATPAPDSAQLALDLLPRR